MRRVRIRHSHTGCQRKLKLNGLASGTLEEGTELADEFVDVHDFGPKRLFAREGKKAAREPCTSVSCVLGDSRQPHDRVVSGCFPADQFEVAGDRGQQIVKVMRNSSGELTDGFHLLRLAERLLCDSM